MGVVGVVWVLWMLWVLRVLWLCCVGVEGGVVVWSSSSSQSSRHLPDSYQSLFQIMIPGIRGGCYDCVHGVGGGGCVGVVWGLYGDVGGAGRSGKEGGR